MRYKAKILTGICVTLVLLAVALPVCGAAYIPTTTYLGFQNGSYLSFDETMNFTTAYQEDSSNATYPDYWFLGNTTVYGFHLTNCNASVTEFFSSEVLNMTLTQTAAATATVKVYTASLGEPNSVNGTSTDSYDSASDVSTITVVNPSSTIAVFYWSDYTITLSLRESIVLVGSTATLNVAVAKSTGETVSNYELNVTKDGNLWKQNYTSTFFTDTESNIQSHFYSVSALYDSDAAETADFTITPLTVSWTGGGSSFTPSTDPTPTPSPAPQNGTDFGVTQAGFELPFSTNDLLIGSAIVLGSVLAVVAVDDRQRKARPKMRRNKGLTGRSSKKKGSLL